VAVLKQSDSSLVTGGITNKHGVFNIKNLSNGSYLLRSNSIGYCNTITKVIINGSSENIQEPITLKPSILTITEVLITGSVSEKRQNIEKSIINVSKNIASITGNVTDVLKGQAGISVDNEENIYIRGNKNTLVLMDGVPTTLMSLNSIPASSIENIEIITNPSAKFDAEGTGGIINIITKHSNISGISGRVILNYNLNKAVNGGMNLHYSTGIWNFDLGYNGKYELYETNSTLDRILFADNIRIKQEAYTQKINKTNAFNLNVGLRPSKKNILSLSFKSAFPELNNKQSIIGSQSNQQVRNNVKRLNDVSWERRMFEGSFSYKHIFQKDKNEFSFDATFSRNKGSRPAEYYIENELLQKSTGGGFPSNNSIQIDYMKAVSKTGVLEVGLKTTSRFNDFDYKFYNLNSNTGEWLIDTSFSNDLEFQEYIHSAYAIYSNKFTTKFEYKIGARLEYNTSKLNQFSTNEKIFNDYWFPFPFIQAKYQFSEVKSVSISLNRRVTRPTFPQINPFISIIDQSTFETGNKYLSPETLDKVEINFSLIKNGYQLRTNLFASSTKDFITQASSLFETDKLMLTYVNGNRLNKVGADLDFTFELSEYGSVNTAISAFYTSSTGHYNEIDLNTNAIAYTGSLKTIVKPEKKTELQLFINYNSSSALPQFQLKEIYYVDFSIKRTFLNRRFSANITVTDVFNTIKWDIESDNIVYKLKNYSKNQTRFIWLGITFNFNAYKATKPQKSSEGEIDNSVIKFGN